MAKLLRQSAGYGPKAFLDDLIPGCGTLDVSQSSVFGMIPEKCSNTCRQQINDEFRHVCGDIHLWSFTESVPTSFGLMSSLVVDKESAVLGA